MTAPHLLAAPSALRDIIHPQFHQNNFPAEQYIKSELGLKLDKGPSRFTILLVLPVHFCR